jgi:hypothetical protein
VSGETDTVAAEEFLNLFSEIIEEGGVYVTTDVYVR